MFDVGTHLDELRSWSTDRLFAAPTNTSCVSSAVRSSRTSTCCACSTSGQIDVSVGRDGESARTVREKVETARALESLPAVAAAAHAGTLSDEQLAEVVKLADEHTDAESQRRGHRTSRPATSGAWHGRRSKPTVETSRARRTGPRHLWMHWDRGPRDAPGAGRACPTSWARSSRPRSTRWPSGCARRRVSHGNHGPDPVPDRWGTPRSGTGRVPASR